MKKVFVAIGNFFKRIWRWIAETAWIQPLLIVGLIFGVIFSIPSISSWIQVRAAASGQFAFYNANSIKGSQIVEIMDKPDELVLAYGDDSEEERFLLVIIEETCVNCRESEDAFKYFSKNWNYDGKQSAPSMKFIYRWDDEDDNKDAAAYMEFSDYILDTVATHYVETCEANSLSYTDYSADGGSFTQGLIPTPVMILYEHGEISDAYFGVEGDSTTDKATFISDFYFHKGSFKGLTGNK